MIRQNLDIILVVTGALTAGIVGLFVAPDAMLRWIFGETALDAVTRTVTRYLGLLVGALGVLLIYAAFHADVRRAALAFGVVEKLAFAGLVLGTPLRRRPIAAGLALADLSIGTIYVLALAGF